MTNIILRPANFSELATFAQMAAKSSMVPPGFKGKPEDIMLAVQMGSELGLAPMQAIQNVAVINGRPAVWGDALIGLCRARNDICEDIAERIEGEGDARTAFCAAKRRGSTVVVGKFSVADAKKAGLWNKSGPWQQYPDRMLQLRARGFALRDAFPDVLRGIITAEEARDTPAPKADEFTGPTIDATPEPAPAEDKAATGANALAARFAAVVTAQDYYAILDEPQTATRMQYLREKRPELFAIVDAARAAAAKRMEESPVDEAPAAQEDGA